MTAGHTLTDPAEFWGDVPATTELRQYDVTAFVGSLDLFTARVWAPSAARACREARSAAQGRFPVFVPMEAAETAAAVRCGTVAAWA
ncbi:MAG: hypothetical protein GY851_35400 [bacterium]|nr:hypothetical protein [bacterium]